ncbi:dirigent protein 22-like [Apium graveolens]|uniref:dirigent protein 22-like n=1 Tax=Apium graveolens TaxID=4045 RepID=UPI003D7922EB
MSNIHLPIILATLMFSFLFLGEARDFYKSIPRETLNLKKEKLSHLHFYFHDIASGPNPTAMRVSSSAITNTSSSFFGAVVIIDDPLTMGPELSSKQVGRAQGMYAGASLSEVSFLMVLNYVFTRGKFNGSAISILGRNPVSSDVREMPIVGGSGRFRFARGYAQARTHAVDFKTGDAVVEYNVYVFHY